MKKKLIIIFFLTICVSTGPIYAQESAALFEYSDNGKRDPLWPLITSSGAIISYDSDFSVSDIALEGIMYEDNGRSLAIVNGSVIEEGHTLGQYKVHQIEKTKIILMKDNKSFELKLKKEE